MPLIPLAEPRNLGELAIIKSLLEGSGIAFVVQNEHVNSLYPGVPFLNSRVMVEEHDRLRAEALLARLRLEIRDVSAQA